MNPKPTSAMVNFQQEITAEIDKVVDDLTTELEIVDIELAYGALFED